MLLGAVGGPKWDGGAVRPEAGPDRHAQGARRLREPAPGALGEVDLLIVRELLGGLYYGERGVARRRHGLRHARVPPGEVERVARRAFELARARRGRLVSVDKANVLDTSRIWRQVVTEVAADYPDVELAHALADSTAMQLVTPPERVRRRS